MHASFTEKKGHLLFIRGDLSNHKTRSSRWYFLSYLADSGWRKPRKFWMKCGKKSMTWMNIETHLFVIYSFGMKTVCKRQSAQWMNFSDKDVRRSRGKRGIALECFLHSTTNRTSCPFSCRTSFKYFLIASLQRNKFI